MTYFHHGLSSFYLFFAQVGLSDGVWGKGQMQNTFAIARHGALALTTDGWRF